MTSVQGDLGFSFRATNDGVVHTSRNGRRVVTLRAQAEIAHDVVDRAVDALDVVHGDSILGFLVSSQDMASFLYGSRAC